MNLSFLFLSDPLPSTEVVEDLVQGFDDTGYGTKSGNHPSIVVRDTRQLEFRFELSAESIGAGSSSEVVFRMLSIAAELSGRFGVAWNVGHQLEPHLGRIANGIAEPGLQDEIDTSLHVAQSFVGMIVDDEFVDEDAESIERDAGQDATIQLADDDEDSWGDLIEGSESFLRFPEFE